MVIIIDKITCTYIYNIMKIIKIAIAPALQILRLGCAEKSPAILRG